jgi:hypothetical protein
MGRELLGGWVFCRDGKEGRRRRGEEVHPSTTKQLLAGLCHKAETQGFGPGSFHYAFIAHPSSDIFPSFTKIEKVVGEEKFLSLKHPRS